MDEIKETETRAVEPSEDTELVEDSPKPTEKVAADSAAEEAKDPIESKAHADHELRSNTLPDKEEEKKESLKIEETPRERALRLELEKTRSKLRTQRAQDITVEPVARAQKPISADKQELLAKYDQQELKNLREVFGVLADEMGFVKESEFKAQSYQDIAQEQIDSFLDQHPELLPENDEGDVLWSQVKESYGQFRPPENPKTVGKLLLRAYNDVLGIQPESQLTKLNAQREKIKVASHTGASPSSSTKKTSSPSGLDRALFKGFSDEELEELGVN